MGEQWAAGPAGEIQTTLQDRRLLMTLLLDYYNPEVLKPGMESGGVVEKTVSLCPICEPWCFCMFTYNSLGHFWGK